MEPYVNKRLKQDYYLEQIVIAVKHCDNNNMSWTGQHKKFQFMITFTACLGMRTLGYAGFITAQLPP